MSDRGWLKRVSKEGYPKARERIGTVSSNELLNSLESTLQSARSHISEWRRSGGDPVVKAHALKMVQHDILVVLETVRELEARDLHTV